jgi:hypothetical protein
MTDKNYSANLFVAFVIKGCEDRYEGTRRPSGNKRAVAVLSKKRAAFRRFNSAFLGLAICIFAWGLQYKLSLYDPPQASSHQVPQAKLLSKDQWSPSPADARAYDVAATSPAFVVQPCILFPLLLMLGAENVHSSGQKHRDGARPWLARSSASLNVFFFRPPPAIA